MRFINKLNTYFKRNWIRLIVAFVLGAAILFGYMGIQSSSNSGVWSDISYYRDAFSLSGLILIFFGLLSLLANFGAFNIFSFYPGRKKDKETGHRENYYEYTERKKESRKDNFFSFLMYISVGILYLIPGIILIVVLI